MLNLIQFADYFLHLDKYMSAAIQQYGIAIYAILFIIIFIETGLVAMPFLPGDSLLFAAGAFAALGSLNIWLIFLLLSFAAIIGDSTNYSIGRFIGKKAFTKSNHLFKKEYLDKTNAFFKKYGVKTIIMARFMPIIRTFAPFIAGAASMEYPLFLTYNILGGLLWVSLFSFGGYYFGNIPIVKENFTLVIYAIIILSILPPVIEYFRNKE